MRHRQHVAPTVRDWALAYWAIIDGTKKLGGRSAAHIIVGTVVLAMAGLALLSLVWKWLLAGLILWCFAKWYRRHRQMTKPVPWDDDYRPEQDDDIPY